ncbi:MAG: YafY family protein [Chloroflexota bacterium]
MRADRLLSIMLLLRANNGMTASVLAQKLEVSTRTIYRDMDALSMAGVPVYTLRGEQGGCFLDEGYRLSLQDLTPTELESLFVQQSANALQDLGLQRPSEDSRLKLLAALPRQQQQSIQQFQNRLYVDTQGWFHQAEDTTYLADFQEAIWTTHKIQVTYTRFNGEQVNTVIAPYGLVMKANIWYIVAQPDNRDAPRIYRLSRIGTVKRLPHTVTVPPDFDLQAYWHAQQASFKKSLAMLTVEVRVTNDLYATLDMLVKGRITTLGTPSEDAQWRRAKVDFHDDNEARAILMSLGNRVIIDSPTDLRDSLLAYAQSIVALYQSDEAN